MFLEKIAESAVGLFFGIWLARYLGPQQFGLLSYSQSFAGLFAAIAVLGLDSIVVREIVRGVSKTETILGTCFWLRICGSLVMLLILSFGVNLTSDDTYTRILIFVIAGGMIFQSFNVIDFYFQAKVLSRYVVFAQLIGLLLSSVIKAVLILAKAPLILFAVALLVDSIILALGLIYFYLRVDNNFQGWHFDTKAAKNVLRESFPVMVSFLATTISLRVNEIIIKQLLDTRSVGLYAASLKLVELWYFIPVLLSQSLFPALVRARKEADYQQKVETLASLLLVCSFCIVIILAVVKNFVIIRVLGEKYAASTELIPILMLAIVFVFFASLRKKILLAEGKTYFIMYYSVLTAIIMSGTSYFFTKSFGLVGASLAYLVTWASSILILPLFLGRFKAETFIFLRSFNFCNLRTLYKLTVREQYEDKKRGN